MISGVGALMMYNLLLMLLYLKAYVPMLNSWQGTAVGSLFVLQSIAAALSIYVLSALMNCYEKKQDILFQ